VPLEGAVTMTDRSGPLANDIRVSYGTGVMPVRSGVPSSLQGSVDLQVPLGEPFAVLFETQPSLASPQKKS
jgi:hypothetical protein